MGALLSLLAPEPRRAPPALPAPTTAPSPDRAAEEAAERERAAARHRRGRAGLIATGSRGVLEEAAPARRSLLAE